MPMTTDGIILNIIQDSDAIIRRETYSQLLELFIGKRSLERGQLNVEVSIDKGYEFYDELRGVKLDRVMLPDGGMF